jgi:DNA (cytosine-5)-methyltransferase 1
MIFGSVCTGIGAAEVAWRPRGWQCAFMSEIDGFPRAVLKARQPEGPLHGDFTTIREREYQPIDLLVGGTPCQSFSVAGFRRGLADARGNLALEYLRLAHRLRPRWLVWENVPGVLSSNGGRDFGALLGGLAELGYGFAWRVLDAQFFGVAQRRRRVFVICHLGDWRRAAAVLFERESLSGDSPPRRDPQSGTAVSPSLRAQSNSSHREDSQAFVAADDDTYLGNAEGGALGVPFLTAANLGKTVNNQTPLVEAFSVMPMNSGKDYKARETDVAQPLMGAGPTTGNQGSDLVIQPVGVTLHGSDGTVETATFTDLASALRARPPGMIENSTTTAVLHPEVAHTLRGDGFDASEDGTGRGTPLIPVYAPEITAPIMARSSRSGAQTNSPGYNADQQLVAVPDLADPISASEGKTYTHEGKGNFRTHNVVPQQSAVRRLTPRECERLQGFPDDYTLIHWRMRDATDGPRYRALGNSMAVPVMAWIAARIDLVDGLGLEAAA